MTGAGGSLEPRRLLEDLEHDECLQQMAELLQAGGVRSGELRSAEAEQSGCQARVDEVKFGGGHGTCTQSLSPGWQPVDEVDVLEQAGVVLAGVGSEDDLLGDGSDVEQLGGLSGESREQPWERFLLVPGPEANLGT